MIGTARSRVSFFMNKFLELGFIDYNGSGVEIHSSLFNAICTTSRKSRLNVAVSLGNRRVPSGLLLFTVAGRRGAR